MFVTQCECRFSPDRNAMPSIGDIEGRLIVTEIVILCCLSCLRDNDSQAAKHALTSVRRCIRTVLKNAGRSDQDIRAATAYASELFEAAQERFAPRITGREPPPTARAVPERVPA